MAQVPEFNRPPDAIYDSFTDQAAQIALEAAERGGRPGPSAVVAGYDAARDVLGDIGAVLGFAEDGLNLSGVSNINSTMGNLGLVIALAQFAREYNTDNPAPAVIALSNSLLGSAVGKYGTTAMKVSLFGVHIISRALSTFGQTAVSGRQDLYTRVYRTYYSRDMRFHRTSVDWYNILYGIVTDAESPAEAQERFERNLDAYVNQIWNDTDGMSEAFDIVLTRYEEQRGTQAGLAYRTFLAGLSEPMRKEISDQFRWQLSHQLKPVIERVQQQLFRDQQREAMRLLNQLVSELNQVYTLRVRVLEVHPSGRRTPLSGAAIHIPVEQQPARWQGRTDGNGVWTFQCTTIGALSAGASTSLVLERIGPDGVETFEKDFLLDRPRVEIEWLLDALEEVEPPELAIVPPAAVTQGTAEVGVPYDFTVHANHIPDTANRIIRFRSRRENRLGL